MPSVWALQLLDNNNCAPSFLRSLCENRRWLFWAEVFFWGSPAPEEKYQGPKQSPTNSHKDQKIYVLLSLITVTLTISCILCVFFDKKHEENSILYHFCTHPCKGILINPDVTTIARCDKCVNTGCIAPDCLCVYAYVRMALSIMPTLQAEVIIIGHCCMIMTAQFFAPNW